MNFSSDSVKHESKNQNEDFYFDLETPRGHFFAVVDFDTHDFANLNATLKGKLETIVNSFVSLTKFSADLFLSFLAKEINNFLYNLREQAGGPQLVGSAALCLLSGNRLSYLRCGDVAMSIYNAGKVSPLGARNIEKLGRSFQETPLTEAVQTSTLEDNDVGVIMTEGIASVLDSRALAGRLGSVGASDAAAIREALMRASVTGRSDRTVLVITGPYERYVDPVLSDLSLAVASLEARLDALAETETQRAVAGSASHVDDEAVRRLEDKLLPQIELMKDDLRGKAGSIDLLELDEKLKTVGVLLGDKADKADVLGLQSDLLKLSVATDSTPAAAKLADQIEDGSFAQASESFGERNSNWQRSFLLKVAGIVLIIGFGSAFLGAWLQSRFMKGNSSNGSPAAAVPAPTTVVTTQPDPSPVEPAAPAPTEIVIKPGDSLKKLAQQYNVPERAIMELNPTITRWVMIQPGQTILIPATPVTVGSPAIVDNTNTTPGTIEVVVGPGDSINRFAQRYGTTPERIRELNPQITNWATIQAGQKLLIPTPSSG